MRNFALGGTGFTLGVSRYAEVAENCRPDLIFIEYAVNDQAVDFADVSDTAEGLIREIKAHSPMADIVFVKTYSKYMSTGKTLKYPESFSAVDQLAAHYDAMSIDVATPIYNAIIAAGKGEEKLGNNVGDYIADDVHPTDKGHALYKDVIWNKIRDLLAVPAEKPAREYAPIDDSYITGSLTYMTEPAVEKTGWTVVDIPAGNKFSVVDQMIYSEEKDDTIRFTFNGTGIGVYYNRNLNNNLGTLACSIDGGSERIVSLKPGTYGHHVTIADDLSAGEHTIVLRHIANGSAETDTSGGNLAGSEDGTEIVEGTDVTPIYLGAFYVLDRISGTN